MLVRLVLSLVELVPTPFLSSAQNTPSSVWTETLPGLLHDISFLENNRPAGHCFQLCAAVFRGGSASGPLTPSRIAFQHLPPTSARYGYTTSEGAMQLSTDAAVSALRKVWVLIRLPRKQPAKLQGTGLRHPSFSLEEGAGKRCSECCFHPESLNVRRVWGDTL